jgi:hypothetical protein
MKGSIKLLISLLLLLTWAARAQDDSIDDDYQAERQQRNEQKVVAQPAPNDRAILRVRTPAPARLRDYQTDRDYQYDRDEPPAQNPFAKFLDWFWTKISELFRSRAYQNIGQYVVLAAVAVLVIWLLLRADVLGYVMGRRAQSVPLDYENLTDNIHEIAFGPAIQEAIDARNFRLAVRLLYLQTLKTLTDRNRIQWKPEKTNRQYAYELANSPLRPGFESLTTQFEYAWYGDFPVDEAQFARIRSQFSAFDTSVK